jgi:hypothetical protein
MEASRKTSSKGDTTLTIPITVIGGNCESRGGKVKKIRRHREQNGKT